MKKGDSVLVWRLKTKRCRNTCKKETKGKGSWDSGKEIQFKRFNNEFHIGNRPSQVYQVIGNVKIVNNKWAGESSQVIELLKELPSRLTISRSLWERTRGKRKQGKNGWRGKL